MRNRILISSLMIVALLMAGCYGIGPSGEQVGDLELQFTVGGAVTKADPILEQGDLFRNLLVVVTDANNVPVPGMYAYRNFVAETTGVPVSSTTISFVNLPVGSYKVYAFANIDHTAWIEIPQPSSETDAEGIENAVIFLTGGSLSQPLNLDKTLSVATVPEFPTSGGILLTGQQEVSVGVEKNIGTVELIRPVVRVKVIVTNRTGKKITLNALGFSKFNAKQSYLIPRTDDTGAPEVPGSYSVPPALSAAVEIEGTGTETEKEVFSTLLFENNATVEYKMTGDLFCDGEANPRYLGSRLHFKLDWSAKTVTVTQTNDAPQDSNTDGSVNKYLDLLCDNTTKLKLYNTGTNIFEITTDLGASLQSIATTGFLMRENNDGYGSNKTLVFGSPFTISKNNNKIKFQQGTLLKQIKDNNQVVPVTYMRRNQDVTIRLNVYFEVATGQFDVIVVNDDWSGDGGVSIHTFE